MQNSARFLHSHSKRIQIVQFLASFSTPNRNQCKHDSLFLSLSCYNDEIYVPLFNGKVIKVPWNDRTRTDHFFLLLQKIYFQYETEGESKQATKIDQIASNFLLSSLFLVFRVRDNVYVTEFEMGNVDDGYPCLSAVLSDSSAIYLYTNASNVM